MVILGSDFFRFILLALALALFLGIFGCVLHSLLALMYLCLDQVSLGLLWEYS